MIWWSPVMYLTSAYIAGVPSTININRQRAFTHITLNYSFCKWLNSNTEINDDYRIGKLITGNEKQWIQEMNSDNRKWRVMTGNEQWWQGMNSNVRKWAVMIRNERWWQEMKDDDRKWIEMTGNESRWQ